MGSDWLHRAVDRRQFLVGGAAGTRALALAACGAGAGGSGAGQGGSGGAADLS
jgi:hypothetical protein